MKRKSNLPVSSSKQTRALSLRKQAIIGTIAVATLAVSLISGSRLVELADKIRKIEIENRDSVCEQYALIVIEPMYFPCHECAGGQIYLNYGEIWRYGFAGMGGKKKRYPSGTYYKEGKWKLTQKHLEYQTQLKSTRIECQKEELRKIYHYPELPEAQRREIKLIRPPGNKQDR